jgi:hypothetical protein
MGHLNASKFEDVYLMQLLELNYKRPPDLKSPSSCNASGWQGTPGVEGLDELRIGQSFLTWEWEARIL